LQDAINVACGIKERKLFVGDFARSCLTLSLPCCKLDPNGKVFLGAECDFLSGNCGAIGGQLKFDFGAVVASALKRDCNGVSFVSVEGGLVKDVRRASRDQRSGRGSIAQMSGSSCSSMKADMWELRQL
jgi:hypothetical protein